MTAVSGAVLAGGRSRRMGRDKRGLEVDGVPLLTRAVTALDAVADEVLVVVGEDDDHHAVTGLAAGRPDAPVRILTDLRPGGHGPLAGIEAALTEAAHDPVLVVAGDHPFIEPGVLRLLVLRLAHARDATAAAIVTDRGPQPLLAAYRRAALPDVAALLDAGERRATALLDHLAVVLVPTPDWEAVDPSGRTAIDVDTPEDHRAVAGADATRDASGAGDAAQVAVDDGAAPQGADEVGRTGNVEVVRVDADGARTGPDRVVGEEPLEIRVCGPGQDPAVVLTTLRTPGQDAELAAGWLWSERLVGPGGVVAVTTADPLTFARPDDQVTVHLADPVDVEVVAHRHGMATASCGVCGRASIDELGARAVPVPADVPAGGPLPWSVVAGLPDRLRREQDVFEATGGIHATGLFRPDGSLVTLREDVGRHNALDAAIGVHVLAGGLPLHDLVGVLSGRIGFELVAKAATAGLPVLVAVGAPSDLAVRTADRFGITLVGFVRRGGGNVYTHPHRVDVRS